MSKQRKLIDLSVNTIKELSLQAINKGFGSVKAYIEHVLSELGDTTLNGLKKD